MTTVVVAALDGELVQGALLRDSVHAAVHAAAGERTGVGSIATLRALGELADALLEVEDVDVVHQEVGSVIG